MVDRVLIAVLGNRHSGKTTTWHTLFGTNVKSGKIERRLYLNPAQWIKVFLVSGSPEERKLPVSTLLNKKLPQVVLCSVQYRSTATATFEHFFNNGYDVFVQWLNPGYGEAEKYIDTVAFGAYLLNKGATIQMRDGRVDPTLRVKEIRQFALGWARHRDLVNTEFPK